MSGGRYRHIGQEMILLLDYLKNLFFRNPSLNNLRLCRALLEVLHITCIKCDMSQENFQRTFTIGFFNEEFFNGRNQNTVDHINNIINISRYQISFFENKYFSLFKILVKLITVVRFAHLIVTPHLVTLIRTLRVTLHYQFVTTISLCAVY